MKRSPGPTPPSPLTTKRTTSESASSRSPRPCIRSVRTSRGRWTPGRSTRTSWRSASRSVATPRIARRVVCGRLETMTTWEPTIALTRVDLPTFGRPARPMKPDLLIAALPGRAPAAPASRRRRSRDRGRRGGGPWRPPPLRPRSRDRRRRDAGAAGARPGRAAMSKSGFIGLAGRPNVGKSTLVNAIVGSHVVIVSSRPQTTRRAIRGVATDLEAERQLVLVDLPGVQRPRDVLTERMQGRGERELADSDVVLFVVNGEGGVGPGDRFIVRALLGAGTKLPVICAVNKADRLGPNELVPVLAQAAELEGVDEVFPISARTDEGVQPLLERLGELVPEGPYMYPPEDRSDQSSELLLAELIREQVLNRTRQEIPHSVEVSVLEVEPRDDGLVVVKAEVWAEAESQKRILIGKGGAKISEIGIAARRSLEAELGARVHLDLQVRVRKHWCRDEDLLDRLGIE